ncbi:MAG: glycosyltransferase family 2 protein [Candidatus Eisenbacteria bacterium]|nr:glycosyltransferase family 2 protein [Candidatus Eisenbacteria bacterium]
MSETTKRAPISVLLLVRDETRDVQELLPTLAFAAEVVVVWDPRGDRAARDAAEQLGARVFERAFDGFGPQRGFALAQCTQPWVLWLDADERLDAALTENLVDLANHARERTETHFQLRRVTWFLGRRIRYCGWNDEQIVRFFRRDAARFDDAPVHEQVHVQGCGPESTNGELQHYSYRTWNDCMTKMLRYAPANAAKAYARGKRARAIDVLVRPQLRFVRMYLLQLGFLDGAHGLVLCMLAATQVALKYAELWDLSRNGSHR